MGVSPGILVPLLLLSAQAASALGSRMALVTVSPQDGDPWQDMGVYGYGCPVASMIGWLRVATGDASACVDKSTGFWPELGPNGGGGGGGGNGSVPGTGRWLAMVYRGNCSFNDKVLLAQRRNASGVIVVNSRADGVDSMLVGDGVVIPTVMITGSTGRLLDSLLRSGSRGGALVAVSVTPGEEFSPSMRTPIVFVSAAFAVVLVASLAWAVFYYARRLRASLASARAKKKMECLAKTGIARLDHRTLKPGDQEVGAEFDACAVCIEGYKVGEVVRILPCKHEFHRVCVDPWLLQHRTCPMCKLNILKALGIADEEAEPIEMVTMPEGGATDPSGDVSSTVPAPVRLLPPPPAAPEIVCS